MERQAKKPTAKRRRKLSMPESKRIEIQVLRYRPEQESVPVWQSYDVEFTDDMSVLQGLQHIKDDLDGTLTFRWSCRMAICGSCGMMINDKPHLSIERDLVVNVEGFVKKLEGIKPYIIPKAPRTLEQGEYLQTPAQLEQF